MTRLLITGGKGQVGSAVARQARAHGFDILAPGSDALNVTDRNALKAALAQFKPDQVINCAAYTAVDKAEEEQAKAQAVNEIAVAFLAELCAPDIPVLHISTDYVFDGTAAAPYREEDPTGAINVYGQTKLAGEQVLLSDHPDSLVLRTSWVYSASHPNFLKTMLRLGAERDAVSVVGDQTGGPTHAEDIATTLLKIAGRISEAGFQHEWHGVYHYAGAPTTSWHGFAEVILDEMANITGKGVAVNAITTAEFPTPAARPHSSVLDMTRIGRDFGIVPEDWRKRAREIVRIILQQESDPS